MPPVAEAADDEELSRLEADIIEAENEDREAAAAVGLTVTEVSQAPKASQQEAHSLRSELNAISGECNAQAEGGEEVMEPTREATAGSSEVHAVDTAAELAASEKNVAELRQALEGAQPSKALQ